MKLTETAIELMFELSNVDGVDYSKYLNGAGEVLRTNLIKLYNDSDSTNAQELIIEIMAEAGYPWFGSIVRSDKPINESKGQGELMSDNEFMDLLPINGLFH